jgi:hypothetical protein
MRNSFEVPKRDCYRWDGHFNYYTKDCTSCQWYRKIENSELCGGGVSFKYLVKADKQRKCAFKNTKQDKERSVVYLDEIIAALANQKAKFTAQNPSLNSFSTD